MSNRTANVLTGFIVSHWRGETPLVRVILINVVGIGIALILLQRALEGGPETAVIAAAVVCCMVVPVWQILGHVKTCRVYLDDGGDSMLPWAGHLALVAILLATLSQTIGSVLALERFRAPPVELAVEQPLTVSRDGMVLLSGEIDWAMLTALKAALDGHGRIVGVELNSDGGLVYAARTIAGVVVQARLDTRVRDTCNSACTLIFAAGDRRVLLEGGRLGFHRYGRPTKFHQLLVDPDDEHAKDIRFFQGRGVADAFLETVYSTGNAEMWFPDREELAEAGLLRE